MFIFTWLRNEVVRKNEDSHTEFIFIAFPKLGVATAVCYDTSNVGNEKTSLFLHSVPFFKRELKI